MRTAEPEQSLTPDRYGAPVLVRPRLGQGAFRVSVTEAYNRACAVTKEHSLPALEAAHIRPFAKEGPHEVRNGLLLRADLHRLFEQGYLTVTPKYALEVSDRLRDDYHNGRSYYPLSGARICVPKAEKDRPSSDLLDWHNRIVFLQ
jgi:putative restriction endonuclease